VTVAPNIAVPTSGFSRAAGHWKFKWTYFQQRALLFPQRCCQGHTVGGAVCSQAWGATVHFARAAVSRTTRSGKWVEGHSERERRSWQQLLSVPEALLKTASKGEVLGFILFCHLRLEPNQLSKYSECSRGITPLACKFVPAWTWTVPPYPAPLTSS
jgi:hypothetical protein